MDTSSLKKYKILFVGTVPVHVQQTHKPREYYDARLKMMVYNHDYFEKNSLHSAGASNFHNVKSFIETHSFFYHFLIYTPSGYTYGMGDLDESFNEHIINHDLRNGLPKLDPYDIVYIDTNTLMFINDKRNANEWIDFFKPLVKPITGCFIIDDVDVFKHELGANNYLGKDAYSGFTSRFCISHLPINNKFLNDFIQTIVRYPFEPILLFQVDAPDGYVITNSEIKKLKRTWNLYEI